MMTVVMVAAGVLLVGLAWLVFRKPKSQALASASNVGTPVARKRSAALPPVQTDRSLEPPATDLVPPKQAPDILKELSPLKLDELEVEKLQAVATICASMEEPHPIQAQLARGLDSPEELMDAVVTDAGLTASVLKTVNSAAFALSSPITSVQHAVTYLGVSVVKGIVAQAAMAESSQEGTPEQQQALGRIWKSACAASAVAQAMAKELGFERPSICATKALFANLGDVVLTLKYENASTWFAPGSGLAARVSAQRDAMGADSALVGSALAESWDLPDDIRNSIGDGLLPLLVDAESHPLDGAELDQHLVVYLADRIGDAVAYQGLNDLADFELSPTGSDSDSDEEYPDLFHFQSYLSQPVMQRASVLLQDPSFRRKLGRTLTTLS
ncbi:MAG: HDOD domain-containing protein [Pseudomonadota bacterium]